MTEVVFRCEVPHAPGVLIGCLGTGGSAVAPVVLDVRTVEDTGTDAVLQCAQSVAERLPTGLAVVGVACTTRDECAAVVRGLAAEGVAVPVRLVVGEDHCVCGDAAAAIVAAADLPSGSLAWRLAYSEPVAVRVRVPLAGLARHSAARASVHTAIDAAADAARPVLEALVHRLAWTLCDTATGAVWGGPADTKPLPVDSRGPFLLHWYATPEQQEPAAAPTTGETMCEVCGYTSAVVCMPQDRGTPAAAVAAVAREDLLRCVGDAFTAAHYQFNPDAVLGDSDGFDAAAGLWRLVLPCRCVAENPRLALPVLEYVGATEAARDVQDRLAGAFGADIRAFTRLDGTADSLHALFSAMLSHTPTHGGGGIGGLCAVQ